MAASQRKDGAQPNGERPLGRRAGSLGQNGGDKDPYGGIHTKTPQGHIPTKTPQGQCYTRPRRPQEGHKTCGKHGVGNHHATTSRTSKCLVLIYLDQTYEGVGGRGKPLPGLEGGVFIL